MFFIRVISGTGLFADKGKIDFAAGTAFCDKIIAVTDISPIVKGTDGVVLPGRGKTRRLLYRSPSPPVSDNFLV
ncbi:TPA: hypothetical protein I7721_16225 [Vibrio vulnificus]|nr:hypothetical protein [Vibrio vulnificus]